MKTVTVANQKGGVGKTTVTRHLAFDAAEMKYRTLIVDLDPQGNLTKTVLHWQMRNAGAKRLAKIQTASSAHRLFKAGAAIKPMDIGNGISLLAGTPDLSNTLGLPLKRISNVQSALNALAPDYDICLIDTPPTMSNLIFAGLMCARYVLMPCDIDDDAMDGLGSLFHNVNIISHEWNPELEVLGVLPNKVNKRRDYDVDRLGELRTELGDLVFDVELEERSGTKLAKLAPVWKNPRGESDRIAAKEMRAVCKAVFNRIGLKA